MLFFFSNGSRVSVAVVNDGLCGKHQELLMNAIEQGLMIAPRQIGSADAVLKKHVAADDKILLGAIKTNAARRMARCFQNHEFILSQQNGVARF